jgi:hypothetical protein
MARNRVSRSGDAMVSIEGQLPRLEVAGGAAVATTGGAGAGWATPAAVEGRRMTMTVCAAGAARGTGVVGWVAGVTAWAIAPMRPRAAAALRLPARMRPPAAAWRRRVLGRGDACGADSGVGGVLSVGVAGAADERR